MEALEDPSSGLTYPALTGTRKQSFVDAERIQTLQTLCQIKGINLRLITSALYGIGGEQETNKAFLKENS